MSLYFHGPTKGIAKQGQGNQCPTPGLKFKEYVGINRENGINLEETGEKKTVKKQNMGIRKKKKEGLPW